MTSLIGELAVGLTWEPADGYDARSEDGKIQIKSRKSWSTPQVNPVGRLGRFGRKKGYCFDMGVYVALNDEFSIAGIWRMGADGIQDLEEKERGGRGLHVGTFVGKAEPVPVS